MASIKFFDSHFHAGERDKPAGKGLAAGELLDAGTIDGVNLPDMQPVRMFCWDNAARFFRL